MAAKIKRYKAKLTAAQVVALYYLAQGVELEHTWSESGGHHLYVWVSGVQYHLSQEGRLVRLG